MVIRELKNGNCFASTQEDHAELSAQFATHWSFRHVSALSGLPKPLNRVSTC
jgi:hypothetical protein